MATLDFDFHMPTSKSTETVSARIPTWLRERLDECAADLRDQAVTAQVNAQDPYDHPEGLHTKVGYEETPNGYRFYDRNDFRANLIARLHDKGITDITISHEIQDGTQEEDIPIEKCPLDDAGHIPTLLTIAADNGIDIDDVVKPELSPDEITWPLNSRSDILKLALFAGLYTLERDGIRYPLHVDSPDVNFRCANCGTEDKTQFAEVHQNAPGTPEIRVQCTNCGETYGNAIDLMREHADEHLAEQS